MRQTHEVAITNFDGVVPIHPLADKFSVAVPNFRTRTDAISYVKCFYPVMPGTRMKKGTTQFLLWLGLLDPRKHPRTSSEFNRACETKLRDLGELVH